MFQAALAELSAVPTITTTAGKRFSAHPGQAMLDSALRAGVLLEHSCRTGRCGSCKAQLLTGDSCVLYDETGLSQTERESGWILSCVRSASSDAFIEVQDLGSMPLFPARTWPCRIKALQRLTAKVLKVVLRPPPGTGLDYHPGQYIEVIGSGGLRRSYIVANAPLTDKLIELHVRQVDGGAISAYWFEQAQVNDLLRLHGPQELSFCVSCPDRTLSSWPQVRASPPQRPCARARGLYGCQTNLPSSLCIGAATQAKTSTGNPISAN